MCAMQAVSGGGICFLERAHVSDGLLDCCCGRSWHKEARTPGHPKVPSLYLDLVRRKLGTCCSPRGVWRLPQNVSERQAADITGATRVQRLQGTTLAHVHTSQQLTAAHVCRLHMYAGITRHHKTYQDLHTHPFSWEGGI